MSLTPSDDKPSLQTSPSFQRIPGIFVFLIPISAIILLILITPDFSRRSGMLVTWLLWLAFFVTNSYPDDVEGRRFWYSYRNLAVVATWLSEGLVPALLLIVVGSILVFVVRLRFKRGQSWREHLRVAFDPPILTLLPIIAAALVYGLLNGQVPLKQVAFNNALALIAALFTYFVIFQVCRYVVFASLRKLPFSPIWSAEERPRLLAESVMAPLMVVLPLIYYGSGTGVLAIIIAMIAAYAVRYHETVDLALSGRSAYRDSTDLLQKLGLVSRALQTSMFNVDREVALTSASQTAAMIAQADGAAIFEFQHEQQKFKLASRTGDDNVNEVVLEALQQTRKSVVVDNAAGSELVKGSAIRSFALVPIGSENAPLGMLIVYHIQPHCYKPTEIELLEILTSQLAAAMDNIQLLTAMEFHTFEMTHLVHLSRISASSLELDSVAAEISDTLHQMTAVDKVVIALLDNTANRLHLLGVLEDNPHDDRHTPTYMIPQFPEVHVLRNQTEPHSMTFELGDGEVSGQFKSFMKRDDLVKMIMIPMVADQKLFGVIFLGSTTPRTLSQHEMELIEAAANQISTQIYNLKVYNETREALERQLQQLSLIEDIVQDISSAHDFSTIIRDVFEAAIQSTQADMVALALVTEADDLWVIEQQYERDKVTRHDSSQSKNEGIIGQVARTGQMVISPDNSQIPYYLPPADVIYLSSLAVPLEKNGEVVGVLNIESKRQRFFTTSQADFLKNLGNHAMISIENTRLLEELRYQVDTLTSLRELSLVLSSAVDTNAVAHAVLQSTMQMLNGECAALFHYNPLNGELSLMMQSHQSDNAHIQQQMTILKDMVQKAATSGETLMVEDVAREYVGQVNGSIPFASLMATPIVREGHVREVLCIGFTEQQQFEARDSTTLSLLASQAAGHLENAELHEQIREGNNRMKAILDSTRDGIILLDNRGRLAEVNPAAQHLMGIPLGDYLEEPFVDVLLRHTEANEETPAGYPRDELVKLARIQRLEPEGPTQREFTRKIPPNQILFVRESGSPVRDEYHQNMGRLLVLRDITDEKLVENYRDEITSMAVHDLRSPLASMTDALRIALDSMDKPGGAAVATQTINLALMSADKLMGLVNSLLELRKTRKMELTRSAVSIAELIDAAKQTLASSAEKAQIPVEIQVPSNLPPVDVDADKIRRVLINLLDNALRYTPQGKPVQIRVIPEYPGHKILVQVADSGPGIPEKERDRIFDQFWQVKENQPLRGTKGNGIGLTFCQRVMEAHGERIWVEASGPLPGACFAFTLPLQNHTETKS